MLQVRDGVAVIHLDRSDGNPLAVETQVSTGLDFAEVDPAIHAVVLVGGNGAFAAGTDGHDMGSSRQLERPTLGEVARQIEDCSKPVVAAIDGLALRGGFELALACHARVASPTARIGLPEVHVGLIPEAGATQRLPRLVDPTLAVAMMLDGESRAVSSVAAGGLFDVVCTPTHDHVECGPGAVIDALIESARVLALRLARSAKVLPRTRDRSVDLSALDAAIALARTRLSRREAMQPVYEALLDAVAACASPFEQGLQRERELYQRLAQGPAARALQYQLRSEREAARPPEFKEATPGPLRTIAVVGGGTMGCGIAICALDAGYPVQLIEQGPEAAERAQSRIRQHYEQRASAGKMDASVAAARTGRLSCSTDWSALEDADLVVEAVFEDLAVKQDVFRKIDSHARAGAILATNTSYLDIDLIAAATSRPQDVLGLHFFSPANVMRLLEVVRGAETAPIAFATAMAFGGVLKKVPVACRNSFGFIGNRIYNAYRRECEFMLEDGAWPEDVDDALTSMGFAMGPFAVADLSGLDIAWRMRKAQAASRDPRQRYVAVLDRLCEAGRFGRKAGAGYYSYADGKQKRQTDAVVREVIEQASRQRGIRRRAIEPLEIRRRALLAMANEAALLLGEGVTDRPEDVDVVLVQGYGFPRWEGGPVFWARQQSREALEAGFDELAEHAGFGFERGRLDFLLTH